MPKNHESVINWITFPSKHLQCVAADLGQCARLVQKTQYIQQRYGDTILLLVLDSNVQECCEDGLQRRVCRLRDWQAIHVFNQA